MSLPPTSNPSFTIVLKNADGLTVNAAIHDEGHHPKDLEAPLMQTVHYTYHESNFSFNYPFEVVGHGVKIVKVDDKQAPSGSKVLKLLNYLVHTWSHQWGWSKGSYKDKSLLNPTC